MKTKESFAQGLMHKAAHAVVRRERLGWPPLSQWGTYQPHRPEKPLPEQFAPFCRAWRAGRISGAAAARALGMPLTSFRYRASRWQD